MLQVSFETFLYKTNKFYLRMVSPRHYLPQEMMKYFLAVCSCLKSVGW